MQPVEQRFTHAGLIGYLVRKPRALQLLEKKRRLVKTLQTSQAETKQLDVAKEKE
jgi:hypothetical protein